MARQPQTLYTYTMNFLLDLLFPKRCVHCGKLGKMLCHACHQKIKFQKEFLCPVCSERSLRGALCLVCASPNPPLDQLFSAFPYSGPIKDVIKTYKYRFVQELSEPLAYFMKEYMEYLNNKGINLSSYCFIPMPIYKLRLHWRGFDHVKLLLNEMARISPLDIKEGILKQRKYKKPQAQISDHSKRAKNVERVFSLVKPYNIKSDTVVLFDDIYTTGATMTACARLLKKAGIKRVIGLVVARG